MRWACTLLGGLLWVACSSSDGSPSTSGPTSSAGSPSAGAPASGTGAPIPPGGAGAVAPQAGAGGAIAVAGQPAAGASGVSGGTAGASGGAGTAADGGVTSDGAVSGSEGDLWIATDGADSNPGSEALPLLTLAAAVQRALAGTTIWVRAGTYALADSVALSSDGDEQKPIRIFAEAGARPIFDWSAQPRGESGARGIQLSGTYWHLKGFDAINAGDNCIHVSGAHNTIEQVNTYGCSDTGIQITANSSDAADPSRAAYNTILNCDSHDNYDAANQGENADGFAAKLYIGPGNVFRGSRAWNNADDGWDLFASDDVVVIEDCWAISNGKIGPAQNNTNGDGNGFKLGGAPRAGDANMGGAEHDVKGCASIENRACGYVLNNNSRTPLLSMNGGRGDGQGMLCSLNNSGQVAVTLTAQEAISAERDADGNLPPIR